MNASPRHDWSGIEVGWALHPDRWGLGQATEVGAESVMHGFDEFAESQLFSCILLDDFRPIAAAERLGFELVDTKILSSYRKEPHCIWALDRNTWTAS